MYKKYSPKYTRFKNRTLIFQRLVRCNFLKLQSYALICQRSLIWNFQLYDLFTMATLTDISTCIAIYCNFCNFESYTFADWYINVSYYCNYCNHFWSWNNFNYIEKYKIYMSWKAVTPKITVFYSFKRLYSNVCMCNFVSYIQLQWF